MKKSKDQNKLNYNNNSKYMLSSRHYFKFTGAKAGVGLPEKVNF